MNRLMAPHVDKQPVRDRRWTVPEAVPGFASRRSSLPPTTTSSTKRQIPCNAHIVLVWPQFYPLVLIVYPRSPWRLILLAASIPALPARYRPTVSLIPTQLVNDPASTCSTAIHLLKTRGQLLYRASSLPPMKSLSLKETLLPQPPSFQKKKNYEIHQELGTGSFGKVAVSIRAFFSMCRRTQTFCPSHRSTFWNIEFG